MAKNFGSDFGPFGSYVGSQFFFRTFYLHQMLYIVAKYLCIQFQGKSLIQTQKKVAKNLTLDLIQVHWSQIWVTKFFFKTLALSVTRCRGQLSTCKISEKTNHPILRKLSDGWTDGPTEGQTDDSDFMGRCPTNVECPI